MKIGIIGSGMIGGTAARLFTQHGHDVGIGNSRGPDSLRAFAAELGGRAHPGTVEEVADFGEVVLLAIPFGQFHDLPATHLAGKIVIDANNYYPRRDGAVDALDADRTTSTELIAEHLAGARVVKAFNTMYYQTLATGGRPDAPREERLALLVAGDDAEAKHVVSELVDQLGFAAVDTGSLARGGRLQQPGSPMYNSPVTGREAAAALEASGD